MKSRQRKVFEHPHCAYSIDADELDVLSNDDRGRACSVVIDRRMDCRRQFHGLGAAPCLSVGDVNDASTVIHSALEHGAPQLLTDEDFWPAAYNAHIAVGFQRQRKSADLKNSTRLSGVLA